MQMLKNIFNSENKYYLELDGTEESQPVQAAVKTAEKVASPEPAKKVAKTTTKSKDTVAKDTVNTATVEKAQAKSKVSPSNGKKASAKSSVGDKKQPEKKTVSAPKSVSAPSYDPPFWVAAMYNTSKTASGNNGSSAEQTFAVDNLMPTMTKYRRTPGPSLNKFKDMARKARTPKG